jgi:hypothetical protein
MAEVPLILYFFLVSVYWLGPMEPWLIFKGLGAMVACGLIALGIRRLESDGSLQEWFWIVVIAGILNAIFFSVIR